MCLHIYAETMGSLQKRMALVIESKHPELNYRQDPQINGACTRCIEHLPW